MSLMPTSQPGFFDLEERYEALSQAGDPLVKLNDLIPWEEFRFSLKRALAKKRKSNAGRQPYDLVLMFKVLVLQSLYNISDHQVEYQIRDRFSFLRFLNLTVESRIPDEKTIWLFRDNLVQANAIGKLFERFSHYLDRQGYKAECGSMIDASIVEAPKQRNSRESNQKIKEGEIPKHWKEKPNKLRQKDVDARWTKKNNETHYGYKNHINADTKNKLVRKFTVTTASESDTKSFELLLNKNSEDKRVWADSAYRTKTNERIIQERGFKDRLHYRVRPGGGGWIMGGEKRENARRTKIRKRVEHVFGFIENSLGGKFIRTIGLKRARWKIGMMNLVYNMKRYEQLLRLEYA